MYFSNLKVWLAILAALVVTALMLWFLDRFSPYSAQNNKEAHPYPCRVFTLKESFWFALTSFTPQGGGEAPKSLSGRVLVAAYWLFVVLMLATFTANLAAFLTVERMQTTVQGKGLILVFVYVIACFLVFLYFEFVEIVCDCCSIVTVHGFLIFSKFFSQIFHFAHLTKDSSIKVTRKLKKNQENTQIPCYIF